MFSHLGYRADAPQQCVAPHSRIGGSSLDGCGSEIDLGGKRDRVSCMRKRSTSARKSGRISGHGLKESGRVAF